jgi:hypothetical protein
MSIQGRQTGRLETPTDRIAQIIRLHLLHSMGLRRPEDILKLELAMDAFVQVRILLHQATPMDENIWLGRTEQRKLLEDARVQQQCFRRLMKELKRAREGA